MIDEFIQFGTVDTPDEPRGTPKPEQKAPPKPDLVETPDPVKGHDGVDSLYLRWVKDRSSANMTTLLQDLNPQIDASLKTYAPGREHVFRGRARAIAADAITKFKPDGGASVRGWVSQSLREIQRHVGNASPIKVPERARIDLARIANEAASFREVYDRDPSDDELAEATGLAKSRIRKIRQFDRKVITESELAGGAIETDDDDPFVPGVDNSQPDAIWAAYVYHDLDPVDKQIYDMTAGRNGYEALSLGDIAKKLKISPSAVSQRAAKISTRLEQGLAERLD